jgi:hypothetical protein
VCHINRIISGSIGLALVPYCEWDRIAGADERRRHLEGKLHCTAMLA